jgi:hypothetical protein
MSKYTLSSFTKTINKAIVCEYNGIVLSTCDIDALKRNIQMDRRVQEEREKSNLKIKVRDTRSRKVDWKLNEGETNLLSLCWLPTLAQGINSSPK